MVKRNMILGAILSPTVLLLAGVPAVSCAQQVQVPQHEAEMHPGHSGQHAISATAKIELTDDPATEVLKVQIGPAKLPAHVDHMGIAQPRDFFLVVPFDGWLTGYYPRLIDASGAVVTARILHHAAFWNTARPDFLCSNKDERIFGAGGEMKDWPVVPGFGYRVHMGDRIRISTMFTNPTDTIYPEVFLEVQLHYQVASARTPPLKGFYPMWIDVQECRDSGFDLEPGRSTTYARFTMKYAGELLGVSGYLHDYGRELTLEDISHRATIAELKPQLDPAGHVLSIPVFSFAGGGGYRLEQGQTLKVTAIYDNPTGKYLADGGMGIVVGYFLPDQDSAFEALERHPAK